MGGKNKRTFSSTLLRSPHDDEPNFFKKKSPQVSESPLDWFQFSKDGHKGVVILRLCGVYGHPGYYDVYASGLGVLLSVALRK